LLSTASLPNRVPQKVRCFREGECPASRANQSTSAIHRRNCHSFPRTQGSGQAHCVGVSEHSLRSDDCAMFSAVELATIVVVPLTPAVANPVASIEATETSLELHVTCLVMSSVSRLRVKWPTTLYWTVSPDALSAWLDGMMSTVFSWRSIEHWVRTIRNARTIQSCDTKLLRIILGESASAKNRIRHRVCCGANCHKLQWSNRNAPLSTVSSKNEPTTQTVVLPLPLFIAIASIKKCSQSSFAM
jgi:hypothetical protein